jgi:hypothetical protein
VGGGTGAITLTGILKGAGTSAITTVTAPTGALLGDSDVQNISGVKTWLNQTFRLRNPANTFNLTFTNPTITADYPAQFMEGHSYLIYKDGSNYVAKRDNWALESSNSDALTVLQYAVNQANTNLLSPILIKGGTTYQLTGSLVLADKTVFLKGLNNNTSGGGVIIEKNFATTAPLIDMTNTVFTKNRVHNVHLKGNSTAGDIGLKGYILREGQALSGVSATLFGTGIELSNVIHVDFPDIQCFSNLTYGLKVVSTSTFINTTRFHGGRINSNPTNLYIAASSANDVHFFGTEFEGASSGYVHGVQIESGNTCINFYGSSFEKNLETNPVVIYDNGNQTSYIGCRFDSDVDYTPINVRSSAKNISFIKNTFQTNAASKTSTVLIDSGATDTNFIANQKWTNTATTVTLSDSGTNTLKLGNSQMGSTWNDRVPTGLEFGSSGTRLIESGTVLLVRDPTNASYRNLYCGALQTAILRTVASVDNITLGASTVTLNLPATVDNYEDLKVIAAPTSPSAGYGRIYAKVVDANNDGLFIKVKKAGAVVEVQIA